MPELLGVPGYHMVKEEPGLTLAPLTALHLAIALPSINPLVDTVHLDLSYFAIAGSPSVADVTDLTTQVGNSLNAVAPGASNPPSNWLSPVLDRSANKASVSATDIAGHLDGSPAGSPIVTHSFTLANPTGTAGYPEGNCSVITFQAPYGTDVEFGGSPPGTTRPRARDRGRIYFGPVIPTASFVNTDGHPEPLGTFKTDLLKWIKKIAALATAPGTINWLLGVWSRKNSVIKSLLEAWIDNRWDYQRRRSDQGSLRQIEPLP